MLKKSTFLFLLLLTIHAYSQIVVNYDDSFIMKFDNKISADAQRMADKFKQPIPFKLEINDSISLYKEIEKISNQQNESQIFIVGGTSKNIIYTNFLKGIQTEQLSVDDKNFLIKDSVVNYPWKLTKETDKLQGFNVYKAYFNKDENTLVEAWYSKEIPFRTGPGLYLGLPGLILKLKITYKDQSNSYKLIEATKVTLGKSQKINPLTKGNQVNREEFKRIYDEYIKKVKENIIMDKSVDD